MENVAIRKIAVLGAGVMGAQIAAHLANAGFRVLLYDLAIEDGDPNQLPNRAIQHLTKLKPTPLGEASLINRIIPANYQTNLAELKDCDLVIEAIAERRDWKESLYLQVAGYLNDDCFFVTNTSGLSINKLSSMLPATLRERFCGVHFFNPPRYMPLVELTPSIHTKPYVLDKLETFLTTSLGKQVVRAKDTPNFIANRVGVFFMLSIFHHMMKYGLTFDEVDALTGPLIGHAKSATFRTIDVVGLDTMGHVIQTMVDMLSDDPWHPYYQMPAWLDNFIQKGWLGQKSGQGVYKKVGHQIFVFDLETKDYVPASKKANSVIQDIFKETDLEKRFVALSECQDPQGKFLWSIYADLFQYVAYHAADIANTVRDIDISMRFGFGWEKGPFEIWQASGWLTLLRRIENSIFQRMTMVEAPLPNWVFQCKAVYHEGTSYSPENGSFLEKTNLSVYQKQLFPVCMLGEVVNKGHTMYENPGVRLWTLGDDVAILSFKSKKNTFNGHVIAGARQAVRYAEQHAKALVIWQDREQNFSYGADLAFFGNEVKTDPLRAKKIVQAFQSMCLEVRYSRIPVVAAIRGKVLGGGCEMVMHADYRVAAFETYIGLVEAGVGLLPAGGGSKEFALKAFLYSPKNPLPKLSEYFKQIAMAEVSNSALDAKKRGFLTNSDIIVMHEDEILYAAILKAKMCYEIGYEPPVPIEFPVMGETGIAFLQTELINLREGGFISDYDYYLGCKIAEVLCGGKVNQFSMVDETWMLTRECEAFTELAFQEKTRERILHVLETGKPLRN